MSFDMTIFPRHDDLLSDKLDLDTPGEYRPEWSEKNNRVFVTSDNHYYIVRIVKDDANNMIHANWRRIADSTYPQNSNANPYEFVKDTGWRVTDEIWNEYFSCEGDVFYGVPRMRDDFSIMSFRGEKIRVQSDTARTEDVAVSINDQYWIYQAHYVGPYRIGQKSDYWNQNGYPRNTLKNRIIYACRVAAAKAAIRQLRRLCEDDFKGLDFPDGLVPIHNVNFFERTTP